MNKLRSNIHKANPKREHESEEQWIGRLKSALHNAGQLMENRERKRRGDWGRRYSTNGARECDRRIMQLMSGAIYNCTDGNQYPSYHNHRGEPYYVEANSIHTTDSVFNVDASVSGRDRD
jgi:hypothetical protein